MEIYCCGCGKNIEARLTSGAEIYPHRPDLGKLPFWKCDVCKNYVGCHYKTKNRTHPLGHIATPELRNAKRHIHAILDPLWQIGGMNRKAVYQHLTEHLGWTYHTAKVRDIKEARQVYKLVKSLSEKAGKNAGKQSLNNCQPLPKLANGGS